eukprot:scaffold32099_cov50-Attheya_sp.AAC.12
MLLFIADVVWTWCCPSTDLIAARQPRTVLLTSRHTSGFRTLCELPVRTETATNSSLYECKCE